jgi:hypothetical protein
MNAPYWTLQQAVEWVAQRAEPLTRWDDHEVDDADCRAIFELHDALTAGKVTAVGVRDNDASPIAPLKWLTLTIMTPESAGDPLVSILPPGPTVYCSISDDGHLLRAYDAVVISAAELMMEFPEPSGPSAAAPSKPNVPESDLRKFLNKTATKRHTKPELRKLADEAFPGSSIPKLRFEAAYRAIPSNQRRERGEHERKLKARVG